MSVTQRNVDVVATVPLSGWPYEALVTMVERGMVTDWARLATEVHDDPWGPVARQLEEYLSYERPYGVAALLERTIARARQQQVAAERSAVADEVGALARRSGLSTAELARRLGTSRSRLSTYRTGRVTPSAAFMVRLRTLVDRLAGEGSAS